MFATGIISGGWRQILPLPAGPFSSDGLPMAQMAPSLHALLERIRQHPGGQGPLSEKKGLYLSPGEHPCLRGRGRAEGQPGGSWV